DGDAGERNLLAAKELLDLVDGPANRDGRFGELGAGMTGAELGFGGPPRALGEQEAHNAPFGPDESDRAERAVEDGVPLHGRRALSKTREGGAFESSRDREASQGDRARSRRRGSRRRRRATTPTERCSAGRYRHRLSTAGAGGY